MKVNVKIGMDEHMIHLIKIVGITILLFMTILSTSCAGSKDHGPREDDTHGSRAYHFLATGDIPRAIEAYRRGFISARRADNATGAARSLSNIGRAYYELGQIDSAALYFVKAREDFVMLNNKTEASKAAAWTALCFASAGDAAQAKQWFNTATASADMDKPKSNRHYYAVMKARIDFELTAAVNDENSLSDAHKFYKSKNNHSALTTIYMLTADLELSRGNCAAAEERLNDALAATDRSRERFKRSAALLRLAKINFCAGNENAGKHFYGRALDSAPKGITTPPMEEVSSCGNLRCR